MKKILITTILTALVLSCSTNKATSLEKNNTDIVDYVDIERVDTISVNEKVLNYTINIPSTWKPYYSHGYLNYTPKNRKPNKYYENHFYVLQLNDEVNATYNLEIFVEQHEENISKVFQPFEYSISSKKTKFGIAFIINHSHIWQGEEMKAIIHIYEYKGKLYILNYTSTLKSFEKYINDAKFMFDSFRPHQTDLKETPQFVELDNVEVNNTYKNYSIEIPKTWFSYFGYHGIIHSPKKLKNSYPLTFRESIFYVIERDSNELNCKTVKEALDLRLEYFNNLYSKFKYEIIEMEHPIYGQYFYLKYGTVWNGVPNTHVETVMKYKDKQYSLNYTSINKYFDEFLSTATKMIESFKVNENI